jgi:hypothetical protein
MFGWLGYAIRLDQTWVATLFGSKPEGRRKVGKPRMSSLEDAKKKNSTI